MLLPAFITALSASAQEVVAPLGFNAPVAAAAASQGNSQSKGQLKTTAPLTLPFFEDFTGGLPGPDTNLWADNFVYINNTMAVDPISRGVATFDGLNENGLPYDEKVSTTLLLADRLTSREIDLSANTPDDSIYMSFYYQPQGNGFYPELEDSLMLFFRRRNSRGWEKVWAMQGSTIKPFAQVMVPIRDTSFFFDGFQFRFINKASMNTNDDTWNVDYIRIAANRNVYDTAVNDIAFTNNPGFMLNDFTYMPYSHFMDNPGGELATQYSVGLRNNSDVGETVNYGMNAIETATGSALTATGLSGVALAPHMPQSVVFTTYNNNVPYTGQHYANFRNTYYIEAGPATGSADNDTIVRDQVFHNFFAYDDGTAEKSYYLNQFSTLPAKTAVEYRLNHDDTMVGVAIYFGRQVPTAYAKYFSAAVYTDISNPNDPPVYEEEYLIPGFLPVNNFYVYQFQRPVPLSRGVFYIGTIQPGFGVSDSLYLGLDANRVGGNHLYYNVMGYWESSTVSGALMIRPIFGPIIASSVADVRKREWEWSVSPSPAADYIGIDFTEATAARYQILDLQGRSLKQGTINQGEKINVSELPAGLYLVKLFTEGYMSQPRKFIKL